LLFTQYLAFKYINIITLVAKIFGVSKFYLYDQGSTDNWEETIKDFIESGLVVPIRWNFNWIIDIRHQVYGRGERQH